jgi:hypothetical protein
MHTQPNPGESEEFARLDGAILGLLVNRVEQRPWSEAEIIREVGRHGNIPDGLDRLHQAGLVHRWDGLVSATRAAVRFYGITQDDDPHTARDRRMEQSVLELLLTPSSRSTAPLSKKEIWRALGAKKEDRLDLTDALDRLDAAGLVDRVDKLAFASAAAARFDQIMNL